MIKATVTCLLIGLSAQAARAQAQSCPGGVLANGGFTDGAVSGSMPSPGAVSNWSMLTESPQVANTAGCQENGFMQMWGNLVVGESIKQLLPGSGFVAGHFYQITLCYRFPSISPTTPQYVRFRLAAASGASISGYPPLQPWDVIGITPNTSSPDWVTCTFYWTAPHNASWITVNPENDSTVNDGALISWGHIDDICITDIPTPTVETTWGSVKALYR